ncbi:MAG TPA: SDR family NAD(P)-dependent oxidoreductase [Bradyrhizobium sp.]|jgi:hypothetical protein|nr:SDR family NAD(P)-dependent oxidoreductase [Bradyrhizobium sp.]
MTKTALVTGGARGIGRACALALSDSGFDIALVDLLEKEMAATARGIEVRGRRTLTFQADVSDFAHAHAIVERVNAKWGQLDVLLPRPEFWASPGRSQKSSGRKCPYACTSCRPMPTTLEQRVARWPEEAS